MTRAKKCGVANKCEQGGAFVAIYHYINHLTRNAMSGVKKADCVRISLSNIFAC